MSDQRLPELLKQMRAAITKGDLTACLQLQGKVEDEWDAIKSRLVDLMIKSDHMQDDLCSLSDGEW